MSASLRHVVATTLVVTWAVAIGRAVASGHQDAVPQEPAAAPIPSQLSEQELAQLFPDAAGKDEIFRLCTKCHPPEKIATKHLLRDGWEELLAAMNVRGAKLTDDEFALMLDYLAEHLPLVVNVNTASVDEISSGLELRHADATAIVEYREKHGKFKTLDDLKPIPNIEFKRIQLKKDAIRFE